MRKLSIFLTFAMVLNMGYGALAQTHIGIVSIDGISNTVTDGGVVKLAAGKDHAFSIRFNLSAVRRTVSGSARTPGKSIPRMARTG